MKNRKLALILSFIYCGLGQIYKGQTLKGIDFAIVYTMSIVACFSHSPWLKLMGLSVLPAMWLIGMIDAYIVVTQRKQWLLVILPGAFVLLLLMCIQIFMGMDEGSKADVQMANVPPVNDAQSAVPPPAEEEIPPDSPEIVQPDLPEFFSVQVGAFRAESLDEAGELRDELSNKGYPARVEDPELTKDGWYRVLVGKFRTDQEATAFAKELRRKENISYIIVNRRSAE